MMKKLLNPFALVAEGFVMGAFIFFAVGGLGDVDQAGPVESASAAIVQQA